MIWPVLDKLDPENKFITYRLFRDSTHFIDGVHVKNLEGLNRDLSKVREYIYCTLFFLIKILTLSSIFNFSLFLFGLLKTIQLILPCLV